MEPRIATLLDQQPYKRLTLDPSVLTAPPTGAPRYIEPSSGIRTGPSCPDSHDHQDHVDTRHKASSQAHSGASLARVLNDPASSTFTSHLSSDRSTPQNAPFQTRSDVPVPGPLAISPDASRRDEQRNLITYPGGDASLIQLPKPPQAPRKTAKRPRIPPLLQGLHQPPPLPPKNKLFPPISERSGPGSGADDHFGLSSAIPKSSTEDSATAQLSPEKRNPPAKIVEDQAVISCDTLTAPEEHRRSSGNTPDPLPAVQNTDRIQTKAKTNRKRTKWSQKETEDLLMGVRRFGIGSWKQILECADFNFERRTAVDLKDRFRICRPGEGLKARKGATTNVATTSNPTGPVCTTGKLAPLPTDTVSDKPGAQEASTENMVTNDAAVATQKDVYGPFPKSGRRARRQFSEEDDRNLLKGFKRHGTVWRAIRDDSELGFSMRQPTDLRDRFRIRYPEEFAKAGFKLKPKEARELKEAEAKAQKAQTSQPPSPAVNKAAYVNYEPTARASAALASTPAPGSASLLATKPSNPASIRPVFNPVTDFSFNDDESERSPVILNRNILQWADENSTSLPITTAATNSQPPALPPSDFPLHPFAVASDGLHINPLATLKLPSTAHWSYLISSSLAASYATPSAMAPPPSLPPPAPLKHALPPSGSSSSLRAQEEMRTPNLPNIVFPYVPSASARNAVHNLPAPADILSERQLGAGDGFTGWVG